MQDKGKGKAEDSSANNDKGKAEDSSANNDKGKAEDVERQFYEDTLLAMELSKNYKNYSDKDGDDSKHYEPESSKGRKSYKKSSKSKLALYLEKFLITRTMVG
jgi:hypothetical protein